MPNASKWRGSFISLISADRGFELASFSGVSVSQSLVPPSITFPDEFQVPGVVYRDKGSPIPSQLIRELSLSDRLLPAPIGETEDTRQETKNYSVRKLKVSSSAGVMKHAALAAGTLVESSGSTTEFLCLSSSDAVPYILSIQGSLTGDEGETFSFIVHADGSSLAGSYREDFFEDNAVEGCILRLRPVSSLGPQVEESGFRAFHSIRVVATPTEVSIVVSADARINSSESVTRIRVEVVIRNDVITLEITNEQSSVQLFVGSAPRERTNAVLAGGLITPQKGRISILNRASGELIRRIPIEGRLSGSAWDGEYLWQTLWPEGRLLKFDIRESGGFVEEVVLPTDSTLNGLSFDDGTIVYGVCSQNIMKEAGETSLKFFNQSDSSLLKSIRRPHVLSSGFSSGSSGIYGVVSGLDQTPVSSDTAIIVLNKETGHIEETIVFPKNFFLEDIHHESKNSILLSVTEGLAGLASDATTAVYQLVLA